MVLQRLVGWFALLMLVGCQTMPSPHAKAPTQTEVCRQHCHATYQRCLATCTDNCPQCKQDRHQTAQLHYQHYLKEQAVRDCEVVRQLNSYVDPLQCRKVTCDCKADLNMCITTC